MPVGIGLVACSIFTCTAGANMIQQQSFREADWSWSMNFIVEIEEEEDGRWIAEVMELPGVVAYGLTPAEASSKAQALTLRVVAEQLEHGEIGPDLTSVSFPPD
jgi:predicted RNase H-like HicB family nuclease